MMAAGRHPREAQRLRALAACEILDTPPEPAFDEMAELAARLTGVSTALITFVDETRQWFKARHNFGPLETPRDLAFCAHAILGDDLMIVEDAARDPRFADNPLVTEEPRIRFYAGAPLITPSGEALGTLALVDYVPRALDESQRRAVRILARVIVDRLELRRRVRADRSQTSAVFAATLDGILIVDHTGRVMDANPAATTTFGLSRAKLVGRNLSALVPHYADARSYALDERVETGAVRDGGVAFPAEVAMTALVALSPPQFVVVVRDLTARHASEAAQRTAVERFHLVARATNDVVWDWDLAANTVWWNENYQHVFKYDRDAIAPDITSWESRLHPDDAERVLAKVRSVLDARESVWSDEYRFLRADGAYASIFDRGYVIYDDEGRGTRMIGAMTDVTERVRLETAVRHNQKMEAIGRLASGIAHDLNNLLTVMQCSAMLLVRGTSDDVPARVQEIVDACERAATLTRQMLVLSRRQLAQSRHFDLRELVRAFTRLLSRVVGEQITVSTDLARQPLPVFVDSGLIEQVLLNLVVNARDAMPRGGGVTVRTYPHEDAYACLEVVDTGLGIAPEVLPHVFEPFFTTKATGRGTGLGLAAVHDVVTRYGGWCEIDTHVGEGTTVRIYLPLSPDASVPALEDTPAEDRHRFDGTEHVLVVEDDESVRRMIVHVLRASGYKVAHAATAAAALAMCDSLGMFDLLLTDVVLPEGRTGRELATRIREIIPRVRVVYTSGYEVDSGVDEAVRAGDHVVPKPFSPTQLLRTVRAALA